MPKKLKINTRDILNIELDYIAVNNIPDDEIGKTVHFYTYYSIGLAVLVSLDNSSDYATAQGNRKYAILKGSFTSKKLDNNVQIELLKRKIITPTIINGQECYKFIENSMPLTVGNIMLALTVSNSPSPKTYMDYFTEDKRLCINSKNSEYAKRADESNVADELSEQGFVDTLDRVVDKFKDDETGLMDIMASKVAAINDDNNTKYVFNPKNPDPQFYKAKNIYGNYTLTKGGEQGDITKDAFEQAREILEKTGRLIILGDSGSGKSELAYMLAKYYTGVSIAYETAGDYDRVSAGVIDGKVLWKQKGNKNYGELGAFVNHIIQGNEKNPDNINNKYVFIRDEIQRSDAALLLGSVWNSVNGPLEKSALLPENLLIIFTACRYKDFCIDEQVLRRIAGIELDYIRAGNSKLAAKLLNNIEASKLKIAEKVLELISDINTAENYQVLSVADFFSIVNCRALSSSVNVNNLEYGRESFEKLGEFYDN